MTRRAVRQIQVGLLLVGAAWRLFLVMPVRHWDSTAVSLALGMMPYCLLAGLAPRMASPSLLVAMAGLVVGVDLASGVTAMVMASSTGAVAVLTGPIVSSGLVASLSLLVFSLPQKARRRARSSD